MKSIKYALKHNQTIRWYQVPIIWLCIGIMVITLIACAHLIVLSLEHAALQPSESPSTKLFIPKPTDTQNQP